MAGVLFVICIPTEQYESSVEKNDNKVNIDDDVTISMDYQEINEQIDKNGHTPLLADGKSRNCTSPISGQCNFNNEESNIVFRKVRISSENIETFTNESENITKKETLANDVRNMLKDINIENASWQKTENSHFYNITFTIETGYRQEKVLQFLSDYNIGNHKETSASMITCSMHTSSFEKFTNGQNENTEKQSGAWNRFLSSIRAQMNVATIVEDVKQAATLNFDFITLLIIAGILAAFGLIEDSTIFLASSMLISPLMGPIIAATFGTVIKDGELTKLGVVNELIGIFIATSVGFVFGIFVGCVDEKYGIGEGLTNEMLSRCEMHSLLVGALTAIASGAAVAIAILGENVGSLVGVAISASLLPPAVNTGLLWALAVLFLIHEDDENAYNNVIKTSFYSDHQATELAILGSISMTITIINVVCIYIVGYSFLKIKEVAPVVSKSQQQFWKHDVKVARDYNKTIRKNDNDRLNGNYASEVTELQGTCTERLALSAHLINSLNQPSYQNTWSPMTFQDGSLLQNYPQKYINIRNPLTRRGTVAVEPSRKNSFQNSRGSIPYFNRSESMHVPSKSPLNKISEDSVNSVSSNSNKSKLKAQSSKSKKSLRKFVVTPATEPFSDH